MDILENLSKLNLNDKEVKIISTLVKSGSESISDLAKKVNIARSSLYRYLEDLEQDGWVEYSLSTQGKRAHISDLSSIKSVIKDKKEQLNTQEQLLGDLIENLKPKESEGELKPKVNYYEGRSGIRQIQWNATFGSKSRQRVLTSYITRDLVGSKWYDNVLLEAVRKRNTIKVLVDKEYVAKFSKKYKSSQEYYQPFSKVYTNLNKRVYDKAGFKIKGKIMIYDNIVAMMSEEGGKLIGSEIESAHLATTYKSVFDVVWKLTTQEDAIDNYISKKKKK